MNHCHPLFSYGAGMDLRGPAPPAPLQKYSKATGLRGNGNELKIRGDCPAGTAANVGPRGDGAGLRFCRGGSELCPAGTVANFGPAGTEVDIDYAGMVAYPV